MARYLLLAAALAACTNNDDVPPPHIASVLPDHAPAGGVVELDGGFFCQLPQSGSDDDPVTCPSIGTVEFAEQQGSVTTWTDDQIMVEVPVGVAGTIELSVGVDGRVSNHVDFTRSAD